MNGVGVNQAEPKTDHVRIIAATLHASAHGFVVLQDEKGSVVVLVADGQGCRGVRIRIDPDSGNAHDFGSWHTAHSLDEELDRTFRVNSGAGSIVLDPEDTGR
ncbi:hypothetical protein [Nocardia niwae]|uniref:hypothetical protein n=1 Tax=Nocardia niwae TaxID=626084 RepID=UPI0033C3083A